ncbi:MAG: hypothetical protein AAFX57_01170 [Bacteroidota bacterium]
MQEDKGVFSVVDRRLWVMILTVFISIKAGLAQDKITPDFQLELQIENRHFLKEGLYPGQERNFFSLSARPELEWEWDDGDKGIKVSLFGRWDQHDDRRTHFDIRELYYQQVNGNLEFSVGLKKIFWGVTESVHLVDIINQTDQVESFDGEQKLGQPMAHMSYLSSFGTFDFFYLPYVRKRQFPSSEGRLRFPVAVERDDLVIDSRNEEWRPSGAFKWSHYVGLLDVGVSYFHGVGREPLFLDLQSEAPGLFYPIIHQAGLELQATTGPVLWKVESIYRHADVQDFTAVVAGFEYTFGNVKSSGIDIGLIGEYLYDERDELAISSFANDIFTGVRLAFNDVQSTEFLAGAIFDLEESTKVYSVETSRRIGSSWKAEVEARIFEEVAQEEFLYFFREDSFIRFSVSKFF